MTLRQPEGVPFMVTVWGKSGIQFAGTTDIYSTFPCSCNRLCFPLADPFDRSREEGDQKRDEVEDRLTNQTSALPQQPIRLVSLAIKISSTAILSRSTRPIQEEDFHPNVAP